MFKKFYTCLKHYYWKIITGLTISLPVYADDDPFPSISTNSGDIVQTAGTHMETAMKYTTIAVGGMLILICIGVIIHRLREDSREKDHGNLVMTFILLALGLTIGFVLIGIGWTAFSTNIQS